MKNVPIKSLGLSALIFAFTLSAPVTVMAAEETPIYGQQLMTKEEMAAHRAKMRNAKTEQEREQIRQQNHELMRQRAKEKGVPFSDTPPAERGRMNQMNRPGQGYGPGGGMRQGSGGGMKGGNGQP